MAEGKRTSPIQFFREVNQEGRKVTWTTRNETIVTTVMVLIMVALAAVFFWLVDLVIGASINWFLGLF